MDKILFSSYLYLCVYIHKDFYTFELRLHNDSASTSSLYSVDEPHNFKIKDSQDKNTMAISFKSYLTASVLGHF